jgi:hypothetical protein
VLRKQRDTLRFGTIRLKWKTGLGVINNSGRPSYWRTSDSKIGITGIQGCSKFQYSISESSIPHTGYHNFWYPWTYNTNNNNNNRRLGQGCIFFNELWFFPPPPLLFRFDSFPHIFTISLKGLYLIVIQPVSQGLNSATPPKHYPGFQSLRQ